MQTIMRAIVLQGETQSSTEDATTTRRSRHLVVQEDFVMSEGDCPVYSDVLSLHSATQEIDRIQEYVNTTVATSERRLGGLIQEGLSSSHSQFEAAMAEHTNRRANDTEYRLRQMIQVAQAELAAVTKTALEEQSSRIDSQVLASFKHTEATIREQTMQLRDEFETRAYNTLNDYRLAAEAHAAQSANLEQRLLTSQHRVADEHMKVLELQFHNSVADVESAVTARLSLNSEKRCNSIEEQLQRKLDAAIAASAKTCRTYVDNSVNSATATLTQRIDALRRDVKLSQEGATHSIEARMQKMLLEAQSANETAIFEIDERARRDIRQSQQRCRDIDDRLGIVEAGLQQQNVNSISEAQWEKIIELIDDKLRENISNFTSLHEISAESAPVVSNTLEHLRTSIKVEGNDSNGEDIRQGQAFVHETEMKNFSGNSNHSVTLLEPDKLPCSGLAAHEILVALRQISKDICQLQNSRTQCKPMRRGKSGNSSHIGARTMKTTVSATKKLKPRTRLDEAKVEAMRAISKRIEERSNALMRCAKP